MNESSSELSNVLDPEILQTFLVTMGEDGAELLNQLIDTYLCESPKFVGAIEQSTTQADAATLNISAHSLKSSSAALGATRLAKLCKELEVMGRKGQIEEAKALVENLKTEYDKVEAAMQLVQQQK